MLQWISHLEIYLKNKTKQIIMVPVLIRMTNAKIKAFMATQKMEMALKKLLIGGKSRVRLINIALLDTEPRAKKVLTTHALEVFAL